MLETQTATPTPTPTTKWLFHPVGSFGRTSATEQTGNSRGNSPHPLPSEGHGTALLWVGRWSAGVGGCAQP